MTSHASDTRRRCWSGRDPQLSAGPCPSDRFAGARSCASESRSGEPPRSSEERRWLRLTSSGLRSTDETQWWRFRRHVSLTPIGDGGIHAGDLTGGGKLRGVLRLPRTKRGAMLRSAGAWSSCGAGFLFMYFVLFPTSSPKPFSLTSSAARRRCPRARDSPAVDDRRRLGGGLPRAREARVPPGRERRRGAHVGDHRHGDVTEPARRERSPRRPSSST